MLGDISMKYTIIGRKYNTEKEDPSDAYSQYKELETVRFSVEANNINDAEKWMILNHADYYMGCTIESENVSNYDFVCVPGPNYYEEIYGDLSRDELVSIVAKQSINQLPR
jgi:hypothetical protein